MIGEAFDGINWGGNAKAAAARTKRTKELKEEGYTVYHSQNRGGYVSYFLFAFDKNEDFDLVKPRNPETHPMGRRLNVRTAHVGMRVAVETMPGEKDPLHSKRGTIENVLNSRLGEPSCGVLFDEIGDRPTSLMIEVKRLRQVAK